MYAHFWLLLLAIHSLNLDGASSENVEITSTTSSATKDIKFDHPYDCCESGVTVIQRNLTDPRCDNFNRDRIGLVCFRDIHFLEKRDDDQFSFSVSEDGDNILYTTLGNYEPGNYCLGMMSDEDGKLHYVAIICDDVNEFYYEELPSYYHVVKFLEVLSSILLVLTAYVYYTEERLADLQGTCVFHLTSMISLATIFTVFTVNIMQFLPGHLCTMAYGYFSCSLSAFVWLHLLSYTVWKSLSDSAINEENRMKYYKLFGYGIPAICAFISLTWIHYSMESTDEFSEINCYIHDYEIMILVYVVPSLALGLGNIFYTIDAERQLCVRRKTPAESRLITYRKRLYINLYIIMYIPLMIQLAGMLLNIELELSEFASIIGNSSGIAVFVLMVLLRKRALISLAKKTLFGYRLFPQKWEQLSDPEAEDIESIIPNVPNNEY